jgi:hypothetical protein
MMYLIFGPHLFAGWNIPYLIASLSLISTALATSICRLKAWNFQIG